jgi:hypothetical protein
MNPANLFIHLSRRFEITRRVFGVARMTAKALKDCNKKHLVQLAKERGVSGWHAMRKDQLIRALESAGSKSTAAKKAVVAKSSPRKASPSKAPRLQIAAMSTRSRHGTEISKPPVPQTLGHASQKDRIIVLARDPYWLHAYWELSRMTLARAQAALGQDWHAARPILRVLDVTSEDTTSAAERHVRDIEIHGGVDNWYIDVIDPPRAYRVDIGYLSKRGKFYVLARSNVVTTPKAGIADLLEGNATTVQQQLDRVQTPTNAGQNSVNWTTDLRDLFEERLRRPLSSLSLRNPATGPLPTLRRDFHFEIDAELIVYGTTEPNSRVTLQGEPVQLRPDGTFTVRFSLPDSRQIIPAVASSADGIEERTIVLAVERNTKELEPMIHDSSEL